MRQTPDENINSPKESVVHSHSSIFTILMRSHRLSLKSLISAVESEIRVLMSCIPVPCDILYADMRFIVRYQYPARPGISQNAAHSRFGRPTLLSPHTTVWGLPYNSMGRPSAEPYNCMGENECEIVWDQFSGKNTVS